MSRHFSNIAFSAQGLQMRKIFFQAAIAVCLIVAVSGALADQGLQSGPPLGQDLPGPLQILNATGEWVGKYHCPVCEVGLNSGVLIFTRDLPQPGQPLTKLIQSLEDAMEKQSGRPAGVALLLIGDGGYKESLETKVDEKGKVAELRLTKAIVYKDEKLGQLAGLAREAKLKNMILALAAPEDIKNYRIHKDADVTVVGYSRHKVLVNRAYGKDQLTPAEADKLSAELTKNLPNVGIPKY
jgi:hypothetical protein